MYFVLVTNGSLGDVKPFLALALGLQRAGHRVRLAGPENVQELCVQLEIEFFQIDQDQQARLGAQNGQSLERGNTITFGLQRIRSKRRIFLQVNQAAWQACLGAEAIVYRLGSFLAVDSIAERLEAPCFKAGLVPYTPTRQFPSIRIANGREFGSYGNRLSHNLAEQVIWQFLRTSVNDFRKNVLGLAPYPLSGAGGKLTSNPMPVLYGFSPAILPRPDDWPDNVYITGHWALEEGRDWEPPKGLLDFLQDGPPPVYVGFGSMVSRDPQTTYGLVLEALQLCGQRGVVASGWGGMQTKTEATKRIYSLTYAPHDWLFPRMAAVVHHGGIGTTTAGLKAGVPNIIVPFNYDQPFWGAAVARLGAGPAPIPRRKLSAERLAEAIRLALEDGAMRESAARIGRQIRAEDGVGRAIEIIQGYCK